MDDFMVKQYGPQSAAGRGCREPDLASVQGAFVILAGPVHLVTANTANAMIDA
jgi:hypothetical protein